MGEFYRVTLIVSYVLCLIQGNPSVIKSLKKRLTWKFALYTLYVLIHDSCHCTEYILFMFLYSWFLPMYEICTLYVLIFMIPATVQNIYCLCPYIHDCCHCTKYLLFMSLYSWFLPLYEIYTIYVLIFMIPATVRNIYILFMSLYSWFLPLYEIYAVYVLIFMIPSTVRNIYYLCSYIHDSCHFKLFSLLSRSLIKSLKDHVEDWRLDLTLGSSYFKSCLYLHTNIYIL